jgi:hypothetical protein
MLMVFNPQCEHCQHETDELLKHMDWFKNTTIVMATSMPYDSMMNFRERYNLATHSNIILGQDDQYFLYSFYAIRNLPFLHSTIRRKTDFSITRYYAY